MRSVQGGSGAVGVVVQWFGVDVVCGRPRRYDANVVTERPHVLGVRPSRRVGWAVAALTVAALLLSVVWFVGVPGRHGVPTPTAPSSAASSAVVGSVVQEGGLPPPNGASHSPIRPIASAPVLVVGVTASGHPLVRHLSTDGSGEFATSLPAGHYTVWAKMFGPASRTMKQQPSARIVIRRGQRSAHVRVVGYVG